MKKCEFCFELIQDEAIKCKHCGEFLVNKNNFFEKAKSVITDKINTIKENKIKHLFVPTNENPMQFDGITFYGNKFKTDEIEVPYNHITNIEFLSSSSTFNFTTTTSMLFALHYGLSIQDKETQRVLIINDGTTSEKGILNEHSEKKIKEQLNFIKNLLEKLTIEQRILRHIIDITENKYFLYKNKYKFYLNGDLEVDGEIKANILDESRKDKLIWMPQYKGYNSSSFNPFEFRVKNKNAKWYDILNKTITISTTYDFDIFFVMMRNFLYVEPGSFFPKKPDNNTPKKL